MSETIDHPDGSLDVEVRVELSNFGEPDYQPPGPRFTLYGDNTVIAWDPEQGWVHGVATPAAGADLLGSASRLGLLESPVIADGEIPVDDDGQYLIVVANNRRIEHFAHSGEPTTPEHAELNALMAQIDGLRATIDATSWTPVTEAVGAVVN